MKRLDQIIENRSRNFTKFLDLCPEWMFKDFQLDGQSNYAFNIILKQPDKELFNRLCVLFDNSGIEYRVGSAGGGNQMRQPYVRNIFKFTDNQIKEIVPIADHVHFFGMYIGNFPDLKDEEIEWLCKIIRNV